LPRWNYVSRNRRIATPRKSSIEIKIERMHKFLDVIAKVKEIKYFDLQKILGFGDGIFERIVKEAIAYYDNEIIFNKKIRVFKYIPIQAEQNEEQEDVEEKQH